MVEGLLGLTHSTHASFALQAHHCTHASFALQAHHCTHASFALQAQSEHDGMSAAPRTLQQQQQQHCLSVSTYACLATAQSHG